MQSRPVWFMRDPDFIELKVKAAGIKGITRPSTFKVKDSQDVWWEKTFRFNICMVRGEHFSHGNVRSYKMADLKLNKYPLIYCEMTYILRFHLGFLFHLEFIANTPSDPMCLDIPVIDLKLLIRSYFLERISILSFFVLYDVFFCK